MKPIKFGVLISFVILFIPTHKAEPQNSASSAWQASNLLNPNVSVIGWFQSEVGHREKDTEEAESFQLKEAELGFQSVVDSYAKADFFISVHESEVDLEEGYINWFSLPYGLALKLGKFRGNFGKFNRTHTPETAFADRPLVHRNYFGKEGLSGTGASLSWPIPISLFFLNFDAETFNTPRADESPTFDQAEKKDLTYLGRLSSYFDLTEATNLTLGGSYANGAAGQEFDSLTQSSSTLRSQIVGFDATLRWKNPRRAIYRSALWQTEILFNQRDLTQYTDEKSWGMFSHAEFQFARRWRIGGRYDYTQSPLDSKAVEKGGLLYLTFTPSEFSLLSFQGKHVTCSNDVKEDLGFLKVTFNIGPHGAHPF